MDRLHFATQFFHFTSKQWREFEAESPPHWIRELFRRFAPRALRSGTVAGESEALSQYEKILKEEQAFGIRTLRLGEPDYPSALERYLPPERRPLLLFVRGPLPPEETELVAIVGTRQPSSLGVQAARNFSAFFSSLGLRVISGLARGVDALAHEENMEMGTIAVLGSGVGEVYPQEHQDLAERILARGGSLLSRYPIWQVPLPQNFPQRNELIAALSLGTVVIEGSEKSGAAITGKLSLEMDKATVVLTQDYRSAYGRGAIRLQQCGATLVTSEDEALEAIFARQGGYPWSAKLENSSTRSFDFRKFHELSGCSVPGAIALLEEGLKKGRIERLGTDSYRFTRKPLPS